MKPLLFSHTACIRDLWEIVEALNKSYQIEPCDPSKPYQAPPGPSTLGHPSASAQYGPVAWLPMSPKRTPQSRKMLQDIEPWERHRTVLGSWVLQKIPLTAKRPGLIMLDQFKCDTRFIDRQRTKEIDNKESEGLFNKPPLKGARLGARALTNLFRVVRSNQSLSTSHCLSTPSLHDTLTRTHHLHLLHLEAVDGKPVNRLGDRADRSFKRTKMHTEFEASIADRSLKSISVTSV